MSKTIMGCAAVSADGYIAYDDGQIGSLFDWMAAGDVEWKLSESDEYAMRTTQASKDFMQSVYTDIGAVIMGRNLFDQTNGWNGKPAAGERVFVVTHE
ncbi:MAG: dihydrofolate reductase, partial [Actinopolymorphaceae bacterium]